MSGEVPVSEVKAGLTLAQISAHLKNPQNLLTYMIFSAWMKFMGVASHIPSISVG